MVVAGLLASACAVSTAPEPWDDPETPVRDQEPAVADRPEPVTRLLTVRLDASIAHLTPRQRQMLGRLIQAAAEMDVIFREQASGTFAGSDATTGHADLRRMIDINYGPWDRFRGHRPIAGDPGPKPAGAGFYPPDMTLEEFESVDMPGKRAPHTVIRRAANGGLLVVPYREAFRRPLERAARSLAQAASVCDDPAFKRYLTLRARALITDDYGQSDEASLALEDTVIELAIGPTAGGEDRMFGYKSAYAAWVLLRDRGWTHRLGRIADHLPDIQASLPVAPLYRAAAPVPAGAPGLYDALFLAGAANAGPKNDVVVMPLEPAGGKDSGFRRYYLRNLMQARFEHFILPTAAASIVPEQRDRVSFDAYLDNALATGFAYALGPRETVNRRGSVRAALADRYRQFEDGKADVLGMHVLSWEDRRQAAGPGDLTDHYVTLLATMFRDMVRAPGGSRAQMRGLQLNYMRAFGAVSRDRTSGLYRVHPEHMGPALASLATQLLILQGNGDYQGAVRLVEDMGGAGPDLASDLQRISRLGLPDGMVVEQGPEVLGLR